MDAEYQKLRNHFEAIINASDDAIISKTLEGIVLTWNASAERIFGYTTEEMIGSSILKIFPAHLVGDEESILAQVRNGQRVNHHHTIRVRKDGSLVHISVSISPIYNADGQLVGLSKVARDISETVMLRAANIQLDQYARHFEAIVKASDDAILSKTLDGIITSWNPAAERIFGYSANEMIGQTLARLLPANRSEEEHHILAKIAQGEKIEHFRTVRRHKTGARIDISVTVSPIFSDDGEIVGISKIARDITEEVKSERKIWQQANFDQLTKLPNRRLLNDRLNHEIIKSIRENANIAIFFIDLDNFKEVNDLYGHDNGDELLIQVGVRLGQCIRKSDTLSRLGGDEFVIILTDARDLNKVNAIANALVESLQSPFYIANKQLYVTCSLGVSIFPEHGHTADDLLKHADQAMYESKKYGKNQFRFFNFDLESSLVQHSYIVSDLRLAVQANQLEVYYQPILCTQTGAIVKAEALVRWNHPTRGLISPEVFIPIAEETGLIHEIGSWVFDQATMQLKKWQTQYQAGLQMSINKSVIQFHADDCAEVTLIEKLNSIGLEGNSIILEITESALMNHTPASVAKLFSFRDHGIQIAIDDFGTGYSSLSYLNKFDIDYLKIDRSFIKNLAENTSQLALCEAIVMMAHKLGLKVIAEGIETPMQKELMMNIGCDYLQGYLFSKPVPALAFEKVLAEFVL